MSSGRDDRSLSGADAVSFIATLRTSAAESENIAILSDCCEELRKLETDVDAAKRSILAVAHAISSPPPTPTPPTNDVVASDKNDNDPIKDSHEADAEDSNANNSEKNDEEPHAGDKPSSGSDGGASNARDGSAGDSGEPKEEKKGEEWRGAHAAACHIIAQYLDSTPEITALIRRLAAVSAEIAASSNSAPQTIGFAVADLVTQCRETVGYTHGEIRRARTATEGALASALRFANAPQSDQATGNSENEEDEATKAKTSITIPFEIPELTCAHSGSMVWNDLVGRAAEEYDKVEEASGKISTSALQAVSDVFGGLHPSLMAPQQRVPNPTASLSNWMNAFDVAAALHETSAVTTALPYLRCMAFSGWKLFTLLSTTKELEPVGQRLEARVKLLLTFLLREPAMRFVAKDRDAQQACWRVVVSFDKTISAVCELVERGVSITRGSASPTSPNTVVSAVITHVSSVGALLQQLFTFVAFKLLSLDDQSPGDEVAVGRVGESFDLLTRAMRKIAAIDVDEVPTSPRSPLRRVADRAAGREILPPRSNSPRPLLAFGALPGPDDELPLVPHPPPGARQDSGNYESHRPPHLSQSLNASQSPKRSHGKVMSARALAVKEVKIVATALGREYQQAAEDFLIVLHAAASKNKSYIGKLAEDASTAFFTAAYSVCQNARDVSLLTSDVPAPEASGRRSAAPERGALSHSSSMMNTTSRSPRARDHNERSLNEHSVQSHNSSPRGQPQPPSTPRQNAAPTEPTAASITVELQKLHAALHEERHIVETGLSTIISSKLGSVDLKGDDDSKARSGVSEWQATLSNAASVPAPTTSQGWLSLAEAALGVYYTDAATTASTPVPSRGGFQLTKPMEKAVEVNSQWLSVLGMLQRSVETDSTNDREWADLGFWTPVDLPMPMNFSRQKGVHSDVDGLEPSRDGTFSKTECLVRAIEISTLLYKPPKTKKKKTATTAFGTGMSPARIRREAEAAAAEAQAAADDETTVKEVAEQDRLRQQLALCWLLLGTSCGLSFVTVAGDDHTAVQCYAKAVQFDSEGRTGATAMAALAMRNKPIEMLSRTFTPKEMAVHAIHVLSKTTGTEVHGKESQHESKVNEGSATIAGWEALVAVMPKEAVKVNGVKLSPVDVCVRYLEECAGYTAPCPVASSKTKKNGAKHTDDRDPIDDSDGPHQGDEHKAEAPPANEDDAEGKVSKEADAEAADENDDEVDVSTKDEDEPGADDTDTTPDVRPQDRIDFKNAKAFNFYRLATRLVAEDLPSVELCSVTWTELDLYRKALSLDPTISAAWSNAAIEMRAQSLKDITLGTGLSYTIAECYQQAVCFGPMNAKAWVSLASSIPRSGFVVIGGERFTRLAALVRAVQCDASIAAAWLKIGSSLPKHSTVMIDGIEWTDVAAYERALSLDPSDKTATAWSDLATTLSKDDAAVVNGKMYNGLECALKALRVFTKRPELWCALGNHMRAQGLQSMPVHQRTMTPVDCYAMGVEHTPNQNHAASWSLLASHLQKGDTVRIQDRTVSKQDALVKLIELNPKTAVHWRRLAVLVGRGNIGIEIDGTVFKHVDLCVRCVELDDHDAWAWFEIALMCKPTVCVNGEDISELQAWSKCVEANPKHTSAWRNISLEMMRQRQKTITIRGTEWTAAACSEEHSKIHETGEASK